MRDLKARFRALPRSAQWLIWAGAAVVGYFGVVEPALNYRDRLAVEADKRAAMLAAFSSGRSARADAEAAVASGVSRFGLVAMPAGDVQRASEFNRAVDAILEGNGVRSHTSTTDISGAAEAALAQLFGADARVERLARHIQFEVSPETVAKVIADLERSPLVAGVSRVEVTTASRRGDDGPLHQVRARISVETLILEKKGRSR